MPSGQAAHFNEMVMGIDKSELVLEKNVRSGPARATRASSRSGASSRQAVKYPETVAAARRSDGSTPCPASSTRPRMQP
eukprot:6034901-Prymnesium_polylepis.1